MDAESGSGRGADVRCGTPARRIVRPPCSDVGCDSRVATGDSLRWGVVATGSIARTVADQLVQLEDAEIHAVSSRYAGRARAFADSVGAANAYGDDAGVPGYVRLAEDPDVDVVYVATPNAQHHAVARTLLERGKHVLLEKTFTLTAAEAEDLAMVARRHERFLMEAVWTRFLPSYQAVLDVVSSRRIGDVRWVQADLGFAAPFEAASRLWNRGAGDGALLDLHVYAWTWAFGVLGLPQRLTAQSTPAPNGVDAMTSLQLGYDDGAQANLLGTLVTHATRAVTVAGTAGLVRTDAPLPNPKGFTVVDGHGAQHTTTDTGAGHAYQLREVTRCIQEGRTESPTMPVGDSVAMMRWFDEARHQIGLSFA